MPTVVECPHCENRFYIKPELVGQTLRCPSAACRQVFVAREVPSKPPRPARADGPKPSQQSGNVGDFVPVVDAQPAEPVRKKVVEAKAVRRPKRVVAEAADGPPAGPKEVQWSDQLPPPQPPADEPDDEPLYTRRKPARKRSRLLLAGMGLAIVGLAAVGGVTVWRFLGAAEGRQAEQANAEYAKPDYAAAARAYDRLAADYPASPNADEYRFFKDLAGMRAAVASVAVREDPTAAAARFRAFADDHKDSRFVKPAEYGRDVLDAGRKLAEDVAGHAEDRVKAFQATRSDPAELARAEAAVTSGRELVTGLERYRDAEAPPLDKLRDQLARTDGDVRKERSRLAVLADARGRVAEPTNAAIEEAEDLFRTAGLGSDPDAVAVVKDARGRLWAQVRFQPDPLDPQPAPAAAPSLLFVAPVGPTTRPPPEEARTPADVYLAVSRGVLYALDGDTGSLLWADRVGPDAREAPERVTLDGGEVALVASHVGGKPGLTARGVKTGEAKWFQPLPAPAAGRPAVVGRRAFLPVRDPAGSVLAFDLPTGRRLGAIAVGQPVGGGAVRQPGTGRLYVPADDRRVFVLDADARGDDGDPLPPRCVQVLGTGHPAGSLRSDPLLLGPADDAPGARLLVLAQADGPRSMKLRAFPLPPPAPGPADGPPDETPLTAAAEPSVPGWAWFAPYVDGERLAVATDAGQFRLFGVGQPGNLDAPLFAVATPKLPEPADGVPVPGLVVPAGDDTFWAFVNGTARAFRLAVSAARGPEVVAAGKPVPVGIPTQPPQTGGRRDVACVVVRSATGAGGRAVAFDLRTGRPRWQRQLGLAPAGPAAGVAGGSLLVDEDGGAALVPADAPAPTAAAAADPAWLVASPPPGPAGPAAVAASADGRLAFAVTPTGPAGSRTLVVRRVAGGKPDAADVTVPAAGLPAGPPVVLGDSLLVPLSDGVVHRLSPGSNRLVAGPVWRGGRVPADATCWLVPVSADEFLATDGGRGLARVKWGTDWKLAGRWGVREQVAAAPALVPPADDAGPARVLVPDAAGSVWLYPVAGGEPVRRWRPGVGGVPAGRPGGLTVHTDANGRHRAAYAADGRAVVAVDPDRDAPLWVWTLPGEADGVRVVGGPRPTADGGWVVTDLAGRFTVLAPDGTVKATLDAGLSGAVPAAAAGPLGADRLLAPLSDGSAAVLKLPE